MSVNEVLRGLHAVEIAPRGKAKLEAFKKIKDRKTLAEIITYTENPFYQYHITPDDREYKIKTNNEVFPRSWAEKHWNLCKEILDDLRHKKISGDKARTAWNNFICGVTDVGSYSIWFSRILAHDLRIGLQQTSYKKIFPDLIPELPLQLCEHVHDKDIDKIVKGHEHELVAEPKLDGLRMVDENHKGKITILSRGNKPFWNTEHIEKELCKLSHNWVLDGEAYAGSHGLTVSILKTQHKHKLRKKLKYIVYDVIPYKDWKKKKCKLTYMERRAILETMVQKCKFIKVNHTLPLRKRVGRDFEAIYQEFVNQGFEGVVLKYKKGRYEFKRSKSWIAVKPVESEKFKIYKVVEGNDRLVGTCGALYVKGTCTYRDKKYKIDTSCGNMTDKWRRYFWKCRKTIIGTMVEIKYDAPTSQTMGKTSTHKTYALRFPRLKGLAD